MTTSELEDLVGDWKKILRLQDWNLTVDLVHHYDLDEGSVGSAQYDLGLTEAKIRLLRPEETTCTEDQDLEPTLVHEMLHVKFAWLHNSQKPLKGHKYLAYEQIVESLAQVLVGLKRSGDKRFLEGQRDQLDRTLTLLKGKK